MSNPRRFLVIDEQNLPQLAGLLADLLTGRGMDPSQLRGGKSDDTWTNTRLSETPTSTADSTASELQDQGARFGLRALQRLRQRARSQKRQSPK